MEDAKPVTYEVHELKILKEFADALHDRSKRFEVRRERSRRFNVGDRVRFTVVEELEDGIRADVPEHVLNRIEYKVTYVLRGWGIMPGYAAIGITPSRVMLSENQKTMHVAASFMAKGGEQ